MMTSAIPQASKHPMWDGFKRSFKQSNYITDFWTWLLTLLSKSAELVLCGSILYSSYQLVPGVPPVPPTIDAFLFLVQQAALDIGGMGLLKLAKRAGLSRESFPMRVGVTLVVLMLMNVVLASVKHALPMVPESVFVAIETVLLIARAVMAVLFGHAIHALREEYSESTITIKDASALQQRVEELSAKLSQMEQNFHQRLAESSFLLEKSFQQRLATELSPLYESFQQYQEVCVEVSTLKARLQHMESATAEELRHTKVSLEKQLQGIQNQIDEQEQWSERPILRALPSVQANSSEAKALHVKGTPQPMPQANTEKKRDARTFVFACLQKNAALKLTEIQKLALAEQYELSEATISRYRKQFFTSRESSSVADDESAEMKAESSDERCLDESESKAVS